VRRNSRGKKRPRWGRVPFPMMQPFLRPYQATRDGPSIRVMQLYVCYDCFFAHDTSFKSNGIGLSARAQECRANHENCSDPMVTQIATMLDQADVFALENVNHAIRDNIRSKARRKHDLAFSPHPDSTIVLVFNKTKLRSNGKVVHSTAYGFAYLIMELEDIQTSRRFVFAVATHDPHVTPANIEYAMEHMRSKLSPQNAFICCVDNIDNKDMNNLQLSVTTPTSSDGSTIDQVIIDTRGVILKSVAVHDDKVIGDNKLVDVVVQLR
jgi:hypothetical protein